MPAFAEILLTILLPMGAVQILYAIIDRKGAVSKKLAKAMPVLKRHRLAVHICGAAGFIAVFGFAAFVCGIALETYFLVCGIVVGLINGIAAGLIN